MSLQIAILGMLWEHEGHPYDIKKRMQRDELNSVISITDGALYYNFEALLKKGYIEQVEVIHTENRPDKTMYAITEKGKQGLREEIYKSFKKNKDIKSLSSAIAFMHRADSDRLAFLIEDIIQKLRERMDLIERNRLAAPEINDLEEIVFLADYAEKGLRNEIEWFNKLLAVVNRNKL
ncbi:PadR family transcriptional regulator [Neobacillus mesonae]|nr:PadR family transcriptional regulator [Neobacillus mesonae]